MHTNDNYSSGAVAAPLRCRCSAARLQTWPEVSEGFLKTSNFLNCIDSIDGNNVRIVRPPRSGSLQIQTIRLCMLLENGDLDVPRAAPLPGTEGANLPMC
ncbi:hypothetical protein PR048_004960 [Dryococelus australis]|uniref:Uncharacterized protein n=1 Tax=Dryococelus australis TaxID=614101 RepID=A0ABQ9I6V3_9NEOP|nr:hypothetical protein PR048_004960 [Dryococelus australis]